MPLCVGDVQSDVFNNTVENTLLPASRMKEKQWHPVLYVSVPISASSMLKEVTITNGSIAHLDS